VRPFQRKILYVNAGFSTQVIPLQPIGVGERRSRLFDESGYKWDDECEGRAMRLALLAGGLMVLGGMAFGDERRVIQSPPARQEAGQLPLWSLDLKGDYTFGSRIMKAGDFGSQAEYHFDLEVLRNLPFPSSFPFSQRLV
jgi:hypothetical protein